MTTTEKFWTFLQERDRIRVLKEQGHPPPFTEDPRLRDYRFPNIYRMDDPSTVWLHGALLRQLKDPVQVVMAAGVFRLLGASVPSGEALKPMFLESGFHEGRMLEILGPRKAPFGTRVCAHLRSGTLASLARTTAALEGSGALLHLLRGAPLCEAVRALRTIPGIGPELAYEIAWDLRQTPIMETAQDVYTWALPSYGAVTATGTLTQTERSYHRRADREATVDMMRNLLVEAPPEFSNWELSEIQRGLTLFYFWTRNTPPPRRFRWR